MEWLKKAPTAVTVAVVAVCGVLAVSVIAAFVVLSINGVDTTEFRQWVQTLGQLLVFPFLGVTSVAAVAAARSSSAAEDQGNGRLTKLQGEKEAAEARAALLSAELERARAFDPRYTNGGA
jgi:hypothetical protein